MTTFSEYLFSVIPARVAAGELDVNDPVAKLAARHSGDMEWPTGETEMWEVLEHLSHVAWVRGTLYPRAVFRAFKWERAAMMEVFPPMMERLVDELLGTRHTLSLAWKDYEKYCEEKANE